MPFGGVIINRFHHDMLGEADAGDVAGRLADRSPPGWRRGSPPTSTTTTCWRAATAATSRG